MEYVCLDLEGVLVPEIWAEVAKFTGQEKFNLTTQDVKDYSELMDMRMSLVEEMNISIKDIYSVCLLYTSPSPRDGLLSRMPSSA